MNKKNLIELVSQRAGCPKTHVEKLISPFFDSIKGALRDGKHITIGNFGTFQVKQMNEKRSRNPSTGESIIIPAKKVVKFKASPKFFNNE